MARKFQGKLHVGRRVQRQKNGDIYVLERTTRYDQATKKTVTVAQKLLDEIDGADGVCPFDTDVCGATRTLEGRLVAARTHHPVPAQSRLRADCH